MMFHLMEEREALRFKCTVKGKNSNCRVSSVGRGSCPQDSYPRSIPSQRYSGKKHSQRRECPHKTLGRMAETVSETLDGGGTE